MATTSAVIRQRNTDATLFVANLGDGVDEDLLFELFLQAGPIVDVSMPRDKVNGRSQGFAFVEYKREEDATYASTLFAALSLCGKSLRVRKAGEGATDTDVGARLFVGNLDESVTDKMLFDTFSAFGSVFNANHARALESNAPRGFGFVIFDSFEASDAAIEALNGQFFAARQIVVQYAFRKDAPTERHGSEVERTLAAAKRSQKNELPGVPNRFFATAPGVFAGGGAGALAPSIRMIGDAAAPAAAALPHPTLAPAGFLGAGVMMPPPLPPALPPGFAGGAALVPPPLPVATGFVPGVAGVAAAKPQAGRGIEATRPAWMTS